MVHRSKASEGGMASVRIVLVQALVAVLLFATVAAVVDPMAAQMRVQRKATLQEELAAGKLVATLEADMKRFVGTCAATFVTEEVPAKSDTVNSGSLAKIASQPVVEPAPAVFTTAEVAGVSNAVVAAGAAAAAAPAPKPTATVDCKGQGDFTTVQAALDSLSARRSAKTLLGPILLYIKSCTYREKISVASNLYNMTIKGESAYTTYLTWDDTAGTMVRGQTNPAVVYGTFGSSSTALLATDLIIMDITFVNGAPMPDPAGPPTGQAVACRVDGDRVQFYSCRFFGWQDTLYDRYGRHYFRDCYIQGRVDFIFGDGQSIYEYCTIYSPLQGAFTAQRRVEKSARTGYVFLRSRILGDGLMTLGRAWGNYSRVIFAYSYIENTINPNAPWSDFGFPDRRSKVFYGEYKNFGPGAVTVKRDNWTGTYILTDLQARPFVKYSFINKGKWLLSPPPPTRSGAFFAPPRSPIPPYPPLSPPPSKPPPPKKLSPPPPKKLSPPPPKKLSPPPPKKLSPPPPKKLSPPPPKKLSPPPPKKLSPPPPKKLSPPPPKKLSPPPPKK